MGENSYPKITVTWDPEADTVLVIWAGETPDHFVRTSDPLVKIAKLRSGRVVGFRVDQVTARAEQYRETVRLSPGRDRRTGPVESPPHLIRVNWDTLSDSILMAWDFDRYGAFGPSSDSFVKAKTDLAGHVVGFMIQNVCLYPSGEKAVVDLLPESEQKILLS